MSAGAPAHLFVYGTLRRGAPMHGLLQGRARWLGPAQVPGRLLDLGAFPALLPPSAAGERVHGELFALGADAAVLLDALDRYEGPRFRRERETVAGPGGAVEAWLYRYAGEASGRLIAGGDYLAPDRD